MEKNQESHVGCLAHTDHDRNLADFDLLSPLKIRGVALRNRIVMSPMCQYRAEEGMANDWHFVHLGSRAIGGAGLIFVEATAVTKQGRISPKDTGIWSDQHIPPLAKIADFIHSMGSIAGIQLAHAGRKGSHAPPWEGEITLTKSQGGWDVVAPSAIPFATLVPIELTLDAIDEIVQAFKMAAKRAIEARFKILEVHSAHGYLLHEFLSPLSNKRTDDYGGSFENRIRLISRVVTEIRKIMPHEMPLFVRISATDWVEGGWTLQESIQLARELKKLSVDLIDTSSGGIVPHAKIPVEKNYQVPFAAAIKEQADIMTGAVGLITEPQQGSEIITSGKADLIFIGREFLRTPYWGIKAEQTLNQEPHWPISYGYAVKRQR